MSSGRENPDGFSFCGFCSAALAAPPSGEERKVVSVLFVDLVGFTARSDQADPEDVRAALRPFHALLKREIERFGGTVEKFIGADRVTLGSPVTGLLTDVAPTILQLTGLPVPEEMTGTPLFV